MDKHGAQFRQTMDDVNYMLRDRQLPKEMCRRVGRPRLAGLMPREPPRLERTMSSQLRARSRRRWAAGSTLVISAGTASEFNELSVCLEPGSTPFQAIDSPNRSTSCVGRRHPQVKVLTHGEIWGLDPSPSKKTSKWRGEARVVSVAICTSGPVLGQTALSAILLDFPELRRIRRREPRQVC